MWIDRLFRRKPRKTCFEIYDEAKAIGKELQTHGFSEWNDRIIHAIESGCMGSEILCNLDGVLSEAKLRELGIPDELRQRIESLYKDNRKLVTRRW